LASFLQKNLELDKKLMLNLEIGLKRKQSLVFILNEFSPRKTLL